MRWPAPWGYLLGAGLVGPVNRICGQLFFLSPRQRRIIYAASAEAVCPVPAATPQGLLSGGGSGIVSDISFNLFLTHDFRCFKVRDDTRDISVHHVFRYPAHNIRRRHRVKLVPCVCMTIPFAALKAQKAMKPECRNADFKIMC